MKAPLCVAAGVSLAVVPGILPGGLYVWRYSVVQGSLSSSQTSRSEAWRRDAALYVRRDA
jgi:hypothetical protein